MDSKSLRKILSAFYKEHGLSPKITSVPDGCYIYTSEYTGGHKIFVSITDFKKEPGYTFEVYLPNSDSRLEK
jgi:hypothetical protein